MRKRRHLLSKLTLLLLMAIGVVAPLWLGMVPARYLPFARIDLKDPGGPFLDFRLAALRGDREGCAMLLSSPELGAHLAPDEPRNDGCGWTNAVRLETAGGARVPAAQITCPMAAALALWMTHEVQPAAERLLGQRVVSLAHLGTYSCRNILGNSSYRWVRSEHAKANAIDIAAFVLADGRRISLTRHWSSKGPEADFLHHIRQRSCRYFRVSLSPDFNQAHHDHFHLDRGPMWTCR